MLLSTGHLVTKPQAATILGLDAVPATQVQLSTEDYLHALINAINELPRLAVNSVTRGDTRTPVRLATFVKQLHAGFQLLNLKNDSLRKRFDAIKVQLPPTDPSFPNSQVVVWMRSADTRYFLVVARTVQYDVKKIEEIVYDISLRGLVKGDDTGADGLAFPVDAARQVQLVQRLAQDPTSTS